MKTCNRCGDEYEAPNDWPDGVCPKCWDAWSSATRIIASWLTCGSTVEAVESRRRGADPDVVDGARRNVVHACNRLADALRRTTR